MRRGGGGAANAAPPFEVGGPASGALAPWGAHGAQPGHAAPGIQSVASKRGDRVCLSHNKLKNKLNIIKTVS